jgi:protein-S-isoprenylcysteine O-methyltransferase Ste14
MGALFRALTYASIFVGVLLVAVPGRLLSYSGVVRPVTTGIAGLAGFGAAGFGAGLIVWCVVIFALTGRGTPAPFDAPRLLVTRGPYRYVRNPMYWGAALVLVGAALLYRSAALAGYAVAFFIACHLFVVFYEEPALRRSFGRSYEDYCRRVHRWLPAVRPARITPASQ